MRNYFQTLKLAKSAIAITALVVVVLGLPTIASAKPHDEMTININTAHLDTSNEAGAAVLYRKIKKAAAKICGDSGASTPLNQRNDIKACINDTVEKAVFNSGLPMLVTVHTGESPVDTHSLANKN